MLRYIEFLLDNINHKSIINCILETEMRIYLDRIVDYRITAYEVVDDSFDVVAEDKKTNYNTVSNQHLKSVALSHFNPIWRLAAYYCDYILKKHKEFTLNANDNYAYSS